MNQTIKKYIIEPLIYPFCKENFKNFIIIEVVLTFFAYCYLAIQLFWNTFYIFLLMLICSFLIYCIELGYTTMVFEDTLNGKNVLPNVKNVKRLLISGLKGYGYSILFTTIVWFLAVLIYFIEFGKILPIFSILDRVEIWNSFYNIILNVIYLVGVFLFSSLIFAVSWNTINLPNLSVSFWNYIFMDYMYISIFLSCYIFPLIIFKIYSKIRFKNLINIVSSKYILISTICGLYLMLIFKYIVWADIFIKVPLITYLFIAMAKMFGVYFRDKIIKW
ncbi:hypothetical protein [Methanocaldococcus sp.]|uniref:hypothetical protein n=1 Tax=Methanocaldococcus sp. TaxID=2152917 RepID=UPI00261C4847|nr:hypothetical protein [Methanocaldococcus sp.]MCQ6254660.1 hypothetical protein [Methanocaldococcus sp.]